MKTLLLIITAALALSGCATDGNYREYLAAQADANRQAAADQKPLVRLTAQPGQSITGLQSLEVYTPTAAPVVQQQRANEWAAVAGQAIGVIGTVGGIRAAGQAAVGLADSVGRAGVAGYQYIQAAPTVTTTTTTTNTDRHDTVTPAPVITPVVPVVPVIVNPPTVIEPVVQIVPVFTPAP